jgi:hypothetical protein
MRKALLFTIEFLSPITLDSISRCHAFSKAVQAAIEGPLETEMGLRVGELSSGLETDNPKYPNHWIMEVWCYNLGISESDMRTALKTLKWMHVTSCKGRVRPIPDFPPEDKLTSRLKDRTPEKRLAHREAEHKSKKLREEYLEAHYGKDRPYSHRVLRSKTR